MRETYLAASGVGAAGRGGAENRAQWAALRHRHLLVARTLRGAEIAAWRLISCPGIIGIVRADAYDGSAEARGGRGA